MVEDLYLSRTEAARRMGCSKATIDRRIADGRLPAYRVGDRLLRIRATDVEKLAKPVPTCPAAA